MPERTLADVVAQLEEAYAATRQRLADDLARYGEPYTPEDMKDSNGRYILLDALIAIAQAKAALEASARPVGGVVARPGDTLILRFGPDISYDRFKRFKEVAEESLGEQLPGVKLVFLGVEELAVYRPEGEPT